METMPLQFSADATVVMLALCITAIAGAFSTIIQKHPIHSAMSLLLTLVSMSGLYAFLGGHLLWLVQLIVYAGAIVVLIIYTIMLMDIQDSDLLGEITVGRWLSGGLGLTAGLLLVQKVLPATASIGLVEVPESFGSIHHIGEKLFLDYVIPFELASVLLLAGIVAALHLARQPHEEPSQ